MPRTPQQHLEGRYTWTDYATWPEHERWEIVDGHAYNMTPAPSIKHQGAARGLVVQLTAQLKGKPCTPFIAPTDVLLSEHDVVQPDVFVICDKTKIKDSHITGAPDLIIEVLSPSTAVKDRREKKALYEKSSVAEYIIIDPLELYAEQFVLGTDGRYGSGTTYGPQESLSLKSLTGVVLNLSDVFVLDTPSTS